MRRPRRCLLYSTRDQLLRSRTASIADIYNVKPKRSCALHVGFHKSGLVALTRVLARVQKLSTR